MKRSVWYRTVALMLTGNGLQRLLAAAAGPAAANKNRRQSQSVATLPPPLVAVRPALPPAPGLWESMVPGGAFRWAVR
jgi:hypothetical protein